MPLQGLNLKRGEAAKALTSWGATLYGIAAILLLTPLMAIPVQRLPLGRPELAFGLAVFCCMPTALSSGVTLTQVWHGLVLGPACGMCWCVIKIQLLPTHCCSAMSIRPPCATSKC